MKIFLKGLIVLLAIYILTVLIKFGLGYVEVAICGSVLGAFYYGLFFLLDKIPSAKK